MLLLEALAVVGCEDVHAPPCLFLRCACTLADIENPPCFIPLYRVQDVEFQPQVLGGPLPRAHMQARSHTHVHQCQPAHVHVLEHAALKRTCVNLLSGWSGT